MNYESEDYLLELKERASQVSQMLQTPGWQKVIYPALQERKGALTEQLLQESEHVKMLLIQQGVMAINNLESFIQQTILDGEEAVQEFRRRKGQSEHP